MTGNVVPWALPGLSRWLDRLVQKLGQGVAVLSTDAGTPPGLLDALSGLLPLRLEEAVLTPGCSPAAVIATALNVAPTLESLLSHELDQHAVMVSLAGAAVADVDDWPTFLGRYSDARTRGAPGPSILVIDPPSGMEFPKAMHAAGWRTALRRGDRVIWAEEHLPATHDGLAGDFAIALAVELCEWRLDLSAALTRAVVEDLAAPLEWLGDRAETPVHGIDPACPLACMAEQNVAELRSRIWRAQLTAIFPALEQQRLDLVGRHRPRLQVDDRLRSLGATSVEEIELGALRFQLSRHLTRHEADRVDLLARARNALAHRRPILPEDTARLLRALS
jgi:hypothetical protein